MALWPALLNGVSGGTAKPPIAAQSASLRNKHMAWKFKRRCLGYRFFAVTGGRSAGVRSLELDFTMNIHKLH
ncbi:hypothetical protein BDW22DRAFT_1427947 [Trametopsis cervina]|nr:hypothetical protein BDW22DRAFT_1427947 [Trametopsis cervina]